MSKLKKVIHATLKKSDVDIEDSGCAMIVHVSTDEQRRSTNEYMDSGLFVRLHSYSMRPPSEERADSKWKPSHPELSQFIGKRVRITIEEIK